MPKFIDWDVIRQTFIKSEKGLTYVQVAELFGVSVQSIEARATPRNEGWKALREAYRVAGKPNPIHLSITPDSPAIAQSNPEIEISSPNASINQQLDTRLILDTAIHRFYDKLNELEPRSLEKAADSLCRLLELRNKLYPPTLSQIVEMVIDLGFSPKELATELRRQWEMEE